MSTPARIFPRMLRNAAIALALALSQPALAAKTAAEFYEDAVVRLDKGDATGAVIQLKNALQVDPKNLSAQVLLGQAYLRSGNPASAEAALVLANRLGADRGVTALPLAQAWMMQFKFEAVIAEPLPEALMPATRADLLLVRSRAHMETRNADAALADIRDADRYTPGSTAVRIAEADLKLHKGDRLGARALVDEAARASPNDATVWNMKGSIAHATGDTTNAIDAYSRALQIAPRYMEPRIARAGLLIDLHRDAEAWRDVEYLTKNVEDDPRGNYLKAVLARRKGDHKGTATPCPR